MPSESDKITATGHGSFALRHTWLKKAHDLGDGHFAREDATINLGVGKNMVRSVQYYANLCGIFGEDVTDEGEEQLRIANVFDDGGYDPYIDYAETIWLIHLKLTTNPSLVTYYEFFNSFNESVFNNERYRQFLWEQLGMRDIEKMPAEDSIKRDVDCFISNYSIKMKEKPTDSFGPLLCELGLIKTTERGVHKRIYQKSDNIGDAIFLYVMAQFWRKWHDGQKTLSLQAITQDAESPGRVFQMHEEEVYTKMRSLATKKGNHLSMTETAGVVNMVVDGSTQNLCKYATNALSKIYQAG